MTDDQIATIFEALEKMKRWSPVYKAVLKATGDKQQALDAIKYISELEDQLELTSEETTFH